MPSACNERMTVDTGADRIFKRDRVMPLESPAQAGKIGFRCRSARRSLPPYSPPADQHLVPYIAVLIRRQLPLVGDEQLRTGRPPPALVELRIDDAERRRGGDGDDRRRADDDHGMTGHLGQRGRCGRSLPPLFRRRRSTAAAAARSMVLPLEPLPPG